MKHAELSLNMPLRTFDGRTEMLLKFQKEQCEVLFAERQSKEFSRHTILTPEKMNNLSSKSQEISVKGYVNKLCSELVRDVGFAGSGTSSCHNLDFSGKMQEIEGPH
jgi:hypothetical protein